MKREPPDSHTFKLTNLPGIGEIFQAPFYDKGKGSADVITFEAYSGGTMDRFSQVQNGQELVTLGKQVIQQLAPWDYETVKDIELTDDLAWLRGAITPTVRQPIGYLLSGAVVMGIGDTVILNDPIAGQGANSATKMAHLLRQRIVEHGNRGFDAAWMQAVFNRHLRKMLNPFSD